MESIMRKNGSDGGAEPIRNGEETHMTGIVIASGRKSAGQESLAPRIAAFIWGGKVRPTPTLPYG